MSHDRWLVTYSLRDNVTLEQYSSFYDTCQKAKNYIVSKEKAGKEHCHAYLEFDKPLQYIQVQRQFSSLHKDSKYSLQIKKAYNAGAVEYVIKDGNYLTNFSPQAIQEFVEAAKISKKKVHRGDLETLLFEFCEYHEERGGVQFLLHSPDRLQLQQYWKDFCAYKKDWKYVDKSFAILRRLEYGAEVLYGRWQDHQKAAVRRETDRCEEGEEASVHESDES